MRRTSVLALAALALLGVLAPDAYAQAPTPTFKINGLIDQLTSYARNVSNIDGNFGVNDTQWYGRTRGRFDIIGEVGKAKGVLGIEIDAAYGQTGSADNTFSGGFAQFGTSGSFDLNTDVRTIVEIKWLYTEFPVPLVPVPTVARIGAQPFGGAANYKLATYANGDFAGVNITSTLTPNVRVLGTYVAVEEALTGNEGGLGVPLNQVRGDDFALILSAEVTPFKGLDLKPMFSYFYASGTTNGSSRQGRGGINTSTAFNPGGNAVPGINEDRFTVGLDARWRSGPFSLSPTVMYQFGNREVLAPAGFTQAGIQTGRKYHARLDAWLVDIRGGFQLGPLLIEAAYMYTTGNSDRNTTLGRVGYFQPLDTDTSYMADWGTQLTALGLDYLQAFNEAGRNIAYPGVSIGWDKYGRHQIGARATYALTPALSGTFGVNGHFTANGVGQNGTLVAGAGYLPSFGNHGSTSQYVGTEFNLGMTWRFAPGLSWDNAFGYLISGDVLDRWTQSGNAKDVSILTSRIRFVF